MGDDSLILREDGYIRMNFPVTSLTYHSNLNIILVKTDVGGVHVLDVNSGVILQSSCLSADDGGTLGVEYAAGADRVFVWDRSGVGARTDYNGVLLLHTALQRPLPSSQPDKIIRIELVLSEAVLLYQCLQSLDAHSIEGLTDFINELKNSIDVEPVRKGVKAQKWSTVTIRLPQSTLRLVTTGVVQELKGQNRRIPALAIASAVGQRANELVPCSRDEETRPLMYSEAERKETFKRWPHMDYKWALPARMAQAGFYHQPSPSGDDRAMCFTCLVCLVCWEKSDEPWVEHERHSPNCPFVRGEYTHNVPISVTNATACAVPCTNVTVVSKGNTGDLIATGTPEGKVNIWRFDCGLKLVKFIHLSPYDSIFSGILATDSNKVWSASLEKDSSTYGVELTAMAFVGMTSQQEAYPQTQNTESTEKETNTNKTKPSLICAVVITRTNSPQTDQPIKEDSSKALFDSGGDKESVQAMNDQNEAKNNLTTNKMLFLLTYDIHSSLAGSITTVVHTSNSSGNSKPGGSKKVCTVARPDDANIYDEIYYQYSDEDTELPQCTNSLLDEQISNVINLNASSSKEDCKMWEPKKIILPKHFKVMPPPPPTALLPELQEAGQATMLDFVGKISQLKSWKSGNLDSVGTKLADQPDAVLQQADPITHYLNMNGPLEISDLKWYEGGDGTEKVKVTTFGGGSKVGTQTAITNSNNDGFDSDPPQEEAVSQGIAIQCLSLPTKLTLKEDSKVTHLLPTEDKEHLLVVISSIEPDKVKDEEETDNDGDTKMEIDEVTEPSDKPKSDAKAYFILYKISNKTSIYTLEDNPVSFKELPFNESPVDVCLLPADKHDQYSFAAVGVDGSLRLYSLPDFKTLSEKRVPKGQFTSVVFCASVERLSVSTKHGMIYFYALNNGEKDNTGDIDEDEFANIDFDMLQRAPRDEVCGPTPAPVIIANKTELDLSDLETLIYLTGYYGTNTTVPYSAVVPGFWCELSPAQRSRSDHQNNRTWRLQNTSSTWDEHVLELTLPYSVSLAHIEFGFTLHSACSANLPIILVTLLKQNLHGIGYKKDASFGHRSDSPIHFPVIDADMSNLENPVNSEEYLQAHNAEILAGPLLLSSGLDMTQQSGTLILTSPRLYRARGRTFLIHIKTLFDPAKDMSKGTNKTGESSSKKTGFIGCDWLHQISLTVRSSPHTDVAMERQQRIAMLESNSFLNTLCEISINNANPEMRNIAMDLLIWVVSIRLQRMRLAKTEKGKDKTVETQQLECVKIIEKHTDALIKNCILCANRSMAKKCVKILLITSEGEKQLPKPWKSTFETTLSNSVCACIPYVGASVSAGAVRWLAALAQQCTARAMAPALVAKCLALLERAARCLRDRPDVYHSLLRARFGLYGLPLERTIFATEIPEQGRGTSTPVTYASVLAGDTTTPPVPKPDYQLKELLNLPLDLDSKTAITSTAWWAQNNGVGVFGAGLSEAMPLHVTCHVASDGTKLESSGARHHSAVVSSLPGAGPGDPSQQLWSVVKEGQMKQSSQDPDSLEDVESSLMECDPQDKMEFSEEKLFKDQEQCGIPWASLVTRPPQHTLVVERMHSGARRYIVLDFGHAVKLTDVIIPSCSDLVTLCIDIWVTGEETDCVKLAFATDIATKHLVLTDIQPPPICRYMKITTIGRYGMSAMKCKIPLGWFYGEIAEIAHVQPSINALNALHQDLTCRFRLATGKLMDLLNPYLELYNGNAAHMMSYLNINNETDTKVVTAYQECIELQQQLHTCTSILRKLQNNPESSRNLPELIDKGVVSSEALLEAASTDKLRVISETIVDMLLYFYFQVELVACRTTTTLGDTIPAKMPCCRAPRPRLRSCRPRSSVIAVCDGAAAGVGVGRAGHAGGARVRRGRLVGHAAGRHAHRRLRALRRAAHLARQVSVCVTVLPLVWEWGALATLVARACGAAAWWGTLLADTLTGAFALYDAPPTSLDNGARWPRWWRARAARPPGGARCWPTRSPAPSRSTTRRPPRSTSKCMCDGAAAGVGVGRAGHAGGARVRRGRLVGHAAGRHAHRRLRALRRAAHLARQVSVCVTVLPLVWEWGALATLVARACGAAAWWGTLLADTLTGAFALYDAPPTSLDNARQPGRRLSSDERKSLTNNLIQYLLFADRCLVLIIYMSRKSLWDWVTGGRAGGTASGGEAQGSPRANECKLHRRKLHKKLLHQMQELEAARRGIQVALEDQQRARLSLKARMAMVGKRGGSRGESSGSSGSEAVRPRPLPAALAARLAHALVAHMLAADTCSHADALMLAAKVVGRLCALSGGASLLDPSCILGLARLAVTLPPWPRHALTTLLQDLVEYESGESPSSPPNEESWGGAGSSRVIRVHSIPGAAPGVKARKFKGPTVADLLADSFGLGKTTNFKPKLFSTAGVNLANIDVEEQLTQVAESDDSESSEEKLEQYFIDAVKKETRTKLVVDNSSSNVSVCWDARLEAGGGGCGGAGEAHARRALLGTAGALAAAVRAPPPAPPPPPRAPPPPHRPHPPLTHTLYDVFRHLALEFHYQMDCTFMENVISLWLTLNGSAWGSGGAWSLATLAVPADTPRIRLASDTVNATLHSLCTLENISLRCWVLSMQALAWIASLPLQTEGSSAQTMGRVILECEHFVPALVKFITMNVNTDGAVASSEPYLGGAQIGAGAGAASALHSVISRVVCARGAAGALAALRAVCGVWRRDAEPGHAYDLQATLLRLAHPMLQVLAARHVHHALPLFLTVAHQSVWHLALEFHYQMDCTFMENVISLWLTLNGSAWGSGGAWSLATLAVPADTPRIRLASDTVNATLHSLCTLENISLRCWVLSMQALAWIASLPLQTEGSSAQTMGRVILECEHFVPALVKFITMNVNTDGAVASSEPYLGGAQIGAGAGAASALHSVISRVVCARGAAGALAALRAVCGVWRRDAEPGHAYDLQATLLRLAHPMLQVLAARHVHHALPLFLTSSSSPSVSTSGEQSQTDESKAQNSSTAEATNVEDERKQQAARTPCFADTVLQHQQIMQKFYRTLSICDGMNTVALNSGMSSEPSSLKEEVFWLVAHMATVASNPALMVTSLMEFLKKEEVVNLSQAMQQLIIRVLDYPEALAAFIDAGGLELALEKLTACHQAGPSSGQGLVSSLMNYLKLPPQMMNLSTPASGNKKNQTPVIETANGLVNIAPLCTVSCGNPTAQAADVLLDGGGGMSVRGACAARRVRAAAWSYHFFSADDASLALTLTLPYAVQLHEVQLQPHLTSLATCPGAVGVEAGCGGTLAPLGPPQSTAGMTFIRLVVARPVVCTTVQIRLYKPRDSSNMGLLQLRLLAAPAFNSHTTAPVTRSSILLKAGAANSRSCSRPCSTNHVAYTADLYSGAHAGRATTRRMKVMPAVLCGGPSGASAHPCGGQQRGVRMRRARRGATQAHSALRRRRAAGGAVSALCACVAAGGAPATHAHAALLAAARHAPELRGPLITALLNMDAHAHAHAFQAPSNGRVNGSMWAVCELVRQLCRWCADGAVAAYVQWLAAAAELWLRQRDPPSAALTHTLASVLWTLKEKRILENLEELITDDLFELVYTWVKDVPESSLLKKSLDAILCSMCYIRPELFRMLLEHMDIPMDQDESMEGLTDDTKVQSPSASTPSAPSSSATAAPVSWEARGWQLQTIAAAAMSPEATLALLHSRLPAAVVKAIADFSEAKLESIKTQHGSVEDVQMTDPDKDSQPKSDLPSMKSVYQLVEWARAVCWSKRLKDWLGGPGNTFWKPLLTLLCHPRPHYSSTWQEDAQYAQLEESTIRLFAELTVCHPANQKLFASTLHSILESMQSTEGISGFTRALILRLVLSPERVWVSLRWAEGGGAGAGAAHPACLGHAVLPLPLCSTVRALLADHRPPMPIMEDTAKVCMNTSPTPGGSSVLRSASDTAITTVAEAWELSLAAASASKDKRVKDVKNTSLKQANNKKRQTKTSNDASVLSVTDDLIETSIRVQVPGLEGFIPPSTTLAQLTAAVPHVFGPHLALTLHLNTNGEAWTGPTWEGANTSTNTNSSSTNAAAGGSAVLRWFGAVGGLALVAARLPRPHAPPPDPPALVHHHHDLDWVKLDDPYECPYYLQEVVELGVSSAGPGLEEGGCTGVPAHALLALGLLLKLPGYADALLDEGARACHLLRLLLGVTHDEDGRSIAVGEGRSGGAGSLGTLPFSVVARLLERAPRNTDDGRALRRALLQRGAVRLLLACLAVFTHHKPNSNDNSQGSNGSTGKSEEKSQLYWAKGTGFGTGSTQQSWNVEQALVRQRTEEEHVTVLLQVLASYMNPGEKWPPEEGAAQCGARAAEAAEAHDLPPEFIDLVANSSLVPAICSYLRNDSVLDMSRHIPLYVHVLRCARALHALSARRLTPALRPLPRLLALMSRTTNSYATKLRMSKKNIFGKMTYSQRFSTSSNSELSEEDEGLAALIADIQATSALMCRSENESESGRSSGVPQPLSGASREARYIDLMRTMQFETFEMIAECAESGFRFLVPYHFEGLVRAAGERAHPARMKRLAQEAATLATSLPLSYSSSVFVRTDADRLDVMKVLITGPSDTPYANGCFVLDVYFPAEYPAVPMLINLETTGRHSVRFNPNLYNDGKVCLSVLNTWHGRPEEKWNAHTSSFLQVLVSIQSLILVPEPYFNEPGYERSRGTRVGSSASLEYNSNIYQACVRWAMLDHLRNPEPCFKEVIQTHFWIKRNEIMQTVANWITELESQSGDERTQRSIQLNLMALKRHYVKLQEELGKLPVPAGLAELDEPFRLPAAPEPAPQQLDHDMEKIVSHVLD
uniref:UBC core domain-containing protein n=1 Tax=Heliothis virescens TaxID=7102 RepID=A0A2A4K910_HELVI